MTTFLAALLLAQTGPADLSLPYAKAIPVNDTVVGALHEATHWEARGSVVSDDGTTIFDADGPIVWFPVGWANSMQERLATPSWASAPLPLTSRQQEAATQAKKGFDPQKDRFFPLDAIQVVSATDRSHLVVRHSTSLLRRDEISRIDLSSNALDPQRLIAGPKGDVSPGRAIADVASPAIFVPYVSERDRHKVGEYRLFGGPKSMTFPFRAGYVPFVFDTARDFVLGFTFSEHGGQDMLLLHRLARREDVKIPRGKGEIGISALLPDGHILTTYKRPFADENSSDSEFGIYECSPPYKGLTYLGPYQIKGSSRNGKYLLISHQTQRKSWLLELK